MQPQDILVVKNSKVVAVWVLEVFTGLMFEDSKARLSEKLHRTLREVRLQNLESVKNLTLTITGWGGGMSLTNWQLVLNYAVPQELKDMEQHVLRRIVESCFSSNEQISHVEIRSGEYEDLNLDCLRDGGRLIFGSTVLKPSDRAFYRS